MNAKLTISRPAESYGETGFRTRIAASELVAEERGGLVALSIKRSAVYGDDLTAPPVEAETVAACVLNRDELAALVGFLSSLPADA